MNRKTTMMLAILLAIVVAAFLPQLFQQAEPREQSEPLIVPPATIAEDSDDNQVATSNETSVLGPDEFLSSTGPIFVSVDESLVDDTAIQKMIAGASVNRYRLVEVNTDILREHMRGEKALQDIYLPLFDGLSIMGRPSEAREFHTGQRRGFGTWRGSVNGDGKSLLSIVVAPGGETEIDIISDQGNYRVSRITGTPYHLIVDSNLNISFDGDTIPVPAEYKMEHNIKREKQ